MDSLERFVKLLILTAFLVLLCDIPFYLAARNSPKSVIDDIVDVKDFKKLLRTKNNVLVCFVSSLKQSASVLKVFEESADAIKGQGTMVLVDCSNEAKKLCKKLKVSPEPHVLKHYKDGEFHKNYDRKEAVSSMLNFMRDPTGDIPWEEDPGGNGIVHIPDAMALAKLLRREAGAVMVMFYAPWCGFCKQLKPEYSAAAIELKGHSVLAAIDVNRPENAVVRTHYNITGFPTLLYFLNGVKKYSYDGDNNKQAIIDFMKNPSAPPPKPVEADWSAAESEVKHLTDETFDDIIGSTDSILVMFYAPWCGHCKRLKPEYEKAAEALKRANINGVLAALDATKDPKTAKKFSISGYPTLKYFKKGELQFDITLRESDKIIEFMKNPKEPPPPPPPEKPWSEEVSEVVHLTGDTFKSFLKKKKHVLVMFYAPWCGHCKKAKPEFTAAAELFKDDPKVEFAAIDCTAHSTVCNAYGVKGYPTIKRFQYLNKEPVEDYNGGRTEADFTSFMKQFSSQKTSQSPTPVQESDKGPPQASTQSSQFTIDLDEKNFDSAIKTHKSIIVFFHADWSTDCNRVKKMFSSTAKLANDAGLRVKLAAMDVTINKLKKNVPLLKYYENGEFVENYNGKYTVEEFLAYIKELDALAVKKRGKDEL